MSKLEEQVKLAKEYGFQEITIPLKEAEECLRSLHAERTSSETSVEGLPRIG